MINVPNKELKNLYILKKNWFLQKLIINLGFPLGKYKLLLIF